MAPALTRDKLSVGSEPHRWGTSEALIWRVLLSGPARSDDWLDSCATASAAHARQSGTVGFIHISMEDTRLRHRMLTQPLLVQAGAYGCRSRRRNWA